MARARNIKPGFFTNEELAECSLGARLLFIGLWTLADREGRLEDRPKRFKAALFPFDSVEVEPLLIELNSVGVILRYQIGALKLIWIPKFVKHQSPHQNEVASILPAYSGNIPSAPEKSEAFALNPSSLNTECGTLNVLPSEESALKPKRKRVEYEDSFSAWFLAYPRRVAKLAAAKAYASAVQRIASENGGDLDKAAAVLLAATQAFAKTADMHDGGHFCPYPATWLNAGQYADEAPPVESRAYDPETDGPWNPRTGIGT